MDTTNTTTITTPPGAGESGLWTTRDVARYLHVNSKTVFNLRGRGLPCLLLGGAVRFFPHEIKDYLAQNRQLSAHHRRQIVREGKPQ